MYFSLSFRPHLPQMTIFSFCVLGFVALTYQVVFVRDLIILFGSTAPATATVLATYFSGLALGGLIFGKIADRVSLDKLCRLYAGIFLFIGMYGFLSPFFFKFLNSSILVVNKIYPLHFAGFNFFTFLFSFLLLVFPAILIGAGFPIVNKILVRGEKEIGEKIPFVYFVETFGSVLGATLAGFWLIPNFGNTATVSFAAILSVLTGGTLFYFFKMCAEPISAREEMLNLRESSELQSPIFLYALFFTGFLALALEVLYTKTLILFIGSSTYAFSIILITFLLGIALGSWVISSFIDKINRGYAYFGLFLGLIGFWLFLTVKFLEMMPFWYLDIFKLYQSLDFSVVLFAQFTLTVLVIFPVTFLMGMIFPLGVRLANPTFEKLGSSIGKLYFSNTFGGVVGSVTAGFLFLPSLGYQKTLILILLAYLAGGIFFIIREKNLETVIKVVFVFFFVFWGVFSIFSSPWSKTILSLGVFPYIGSYIQIDKETLGQVLQKDKIVFYKEGLSNIAVIDRGGDRILRINGKTDASNSIGDLEAEILIGALPMLFHPEPKDALVIGLGSGITLGTITQFDEVKNIDLVEIDPAIVEAAQYFKNDNHNALRNPKVKTIIADGRNHLTLTDKKYDVISSEPSNFWVSGNAALFSKEFYELAKSRLKKDGMVLQWLQGYALSPEDIQSVIKTFQETFPQTYLFDSMGSGDLFLVGSISEKPLLDFDVLTKKFDNPDIAKELSRIFITTPYELLAYVTAGPKELDIYSAASPVLTDDRLFVEFSAPKTLYQSTISYLFGDFAQLHEQTDVVNLVVGGNKVILKKYYDLAQSLIPLKIAFANDDLSGALEAYEEARESGLSQALVETHLLRRCNVRASLVQLKEGEEAASRVWERCFEVIGVGVVKKEI